MTTLGQRIDALDMGAWAALTKRTAQSAVDAAEQAGQQPAAHLVAITKMSETELIDNRRKNMWQSARRPPTLRMRLLEVEHQRAAATRRADKFEQDKIDAVADAAAARAEAQASAADAQEARERTRTAREELARRELQRSAELHEARQELENLGNELMQARADAAAARAEAAESANAAKAAKEREGAALDEFARQGSQLAGKRREVEAALEASQAEVATLRAELERARADAGAQVAAAVEQASAAQQRAEERVAERAADRREAQAELERLRGEIERIRSDAETEIAAATERVRAAEDRANARAAQRAADRAEARQAIEELQTFLEQARAHAATEVDAAQHQAAVAIAAAQQGMDETITRVRAEAQQKVDEAVQARAHAEAELDGTRAAAARPAGTAGLSIPIPAWELRPETRRVENALTALHQINYILEVGMAEEVEAQIPLDADLVRSLARTVQSQAKVLGEELGDLPARFSAESEAEAAATYRDAAAGACQGLLRRIGTAAQQLRHRERGPDAEVIAAVMSMLADPEVQQLVPE